MGYYLGNGGCSGCPKVRERETRELGSEVTGPGEELACNAEFKGTPRNKTKHPAAEAKKHFDAIFLQNQNNAKSG